MNDDQIIMNLEDELKKLEQERDEAQALAEEYRLKLPTTAQAMAYQSLLNKHEEAQAKCAEMREALDRLVSTWDKQSSTWPINSIVEQARKALSTDCGKGYVAASELDETKRVLKHAIEYTTRYKDAIDSSLRKELARLQALKEGK